MSIRRHFLILDHQVTNIVDEFEFGETHNIVILIPGELEDSTLGIGAAGDHIDVLDRVNLFFVFKHVLFILLSMRMCPAASKSLVRSANSNDGGKCSMLHPSRNQRGSAP